MSQRQNFIVDGYSGLKCHLYVPWLDVPSTHQMALKREVSRLAQYGVITVRASITRCGLDQWRKPGRPESETYGRSVRPKGFGLYCPGGEGWAKTAARLEPVWMDLRRSGEGRKTSPLLSSLQYVLCRTLWASKAPIRPVWLLAEHSQLQDDGHGF
jgi:hypothetical protein